MALFYGFGSGLLAQTGALDNTFGIDGIVTTEFHLSFGEATSVAIQADGKIVAAGYSNYDFVVARYNAEGTLDNSFGDGGATIIDFGPNDARANALVIQQDGKIVATGSYGFQSPGIPPYDFALARVNIDGSLDTSFGDGGKVITSIGTNDNANSIALQPDGKIVTAGKSGNNFALVRYDTFGNLDDNFGFGGVVITDFGGGDEAKSVIVQPDGKIVAAGRVNGNDFALARYYENGILDDSFGSGGIIITDFGGAAGASSVILQPDGNIVAVGHTGGHFALARYKAEGILDTSFGSGGLTITNVGGAAWANSVKLQSDGNIVIAGRAGNELAVARYNINGTLDGSFGTGGISTTLIAMYGNTASSLALQPDGKLVMAGMSGGYLGDFTLARFSADGILDNTFHSDGIVTSSLNKSNEAANDLVIQPDGKIIVAGRSVIEQGVFLNDALVRYEPDGKFDSSFVSIIALGDGGYSYRFATEVALNPVDGKIVVVGQGGGDESANWCFIKSHHQDGEIDDSFGSGGGASFDLSYFVNAGVAGSLAIQHDGKIIAGGSGHFPGFSNSDFMLARINQDGNIDTSFGVDGFSITDLGNNYYDYLSAVVVQSDGKIVAAGTTWSSGNNVAIARYNEDGTLDQSLGSGGLIISDFGSDENVNSVAIQFDEKIVVAGDQDGNFFLSRYNSNGTLDNTFGSNGWVTTDFGGIDKIMSIAIQADNKIIAAGATSDSTATNSDIALARYNEDGTLDENFGANGILNTDIGNFDVANSVAIQTDHKIVIAGESDGDFAIARYLSGLETDVFEKQETVISQVYIFPNPANDFLNIELPKNASPDYLTIYDAHGRIVASKEFAVGQRLSVGHFPKGFYSVKLTGEERVYVGTFVKQ